MRRILLAYTVNQLGTWFAYVALMLSVYDHTHSALAVASLLVAGRLLPALLTPTLVAKVELSERRGGLSRLYMLEGVVALALAGLLWHFWLPGLLVLVAIDGTAALTAGALLRATAARVAVEETEPTPKAEETAQREANAALNVAFTASVTLGPAISGVIVAAAGSPAALLIDAVSFFVCGALLRSLQVHASAEAGGRSVRSRLAAAWGYLQTAPALRGLLAHRGAGDRVLRLGGAGGGAVREVDAERGRPRLRLSDGGVGRGHGAGQPGVCARSLHRSLRPMLTWGTLAVGVSYIGFSLSPTLAVACGAAVVGGMGNGVQWAALISSVQHLTPRELLGRLMGTVEGIGALCPAIGFVLGGVLAELTSPRTALLWIGVAATLCTFLFVRVTRREMAGARVQAPAEVTGEAQAVAEHR